MTRMLATIAVALTMTATAFAQDATGGPVGGPNQAQSVVPKGATGGRAGGPNQSQYVKKAHHSKKKHH